MSTHENKDPRPSTPAIDAIARSAVICGIPGIVGMVIAFTLAAACGDGGFILGVFVGIPSAMAAIVFLGTMFVYSPDARLEEIALSEWRERGNRDVV